jgi:hypothetical protein
MVLAHQKMVHKWSPLQFFNLCELGLPIEDIQKRVLLYSYDDRL